MSGYSSSSGSAFEISSSSRISLDHLRLLLCIDARPGAALKFKEVAIKFGHEEFVQVEEELHLVETQQPPQAVLVNHELTELV